MSEPHAIFEPAPMPAKVIRIRTVIPFSFPFSQKILRVEVDKTLVTSVFETEKREDIANLLFPSIIPKLRIHTDSIGVAGLGHIYDDWSWMSPDRFGQLNFMKTIFYIELYQEEILSLGSEETRRKFLSICADVINLISAGYRITTKEYFPRNYTHEDFMGYSISYSTDGQNFQKAVTCTGSNVSFQTSYPDDSPHVDVNDIISDYVITIPLHTELIINAEDFFRDKNYRISIIEADTAVESLLSKILRKYYSTEANLPTGEFKETFLEQIEKGRIEDNIQYIRLISKDILAGKEWGNWKSKCHDVRNGVIHRNKNQLWMKQKEQ